MIALVAFVTVIGLFETGICFASAWRIYVREFGQFIYPNWTESIHVVLSTLTATPIQALFIWRCHHILKKRTYVTIPLVLALISSVVLTALVTAHIFVGHSSPKPARLEDYRPSATTIWWPFVACLAVPAALDIVITGILLYSLTTFLRRIHTEQLRGRILRFIVVVWQASIPPGLCATTLLIKYIVFTETHPGQQEKWYGTIQAMLGKLYILSLFYTLNNRMDFTRGPSVTYPSTLDPSALESASLPAQRYVFPVYLPDMEEC